MDLSPEMVSKNVLFAELSLLPIGPVFNQQRKISYSLKKIEQAVEPAFSNYEMIAVNDGGTDNTLTILKGIALTDQHIRILSYTTNRGRRGQTGSFAFEWRPQ
jgi:hypothetical protein